MRFDRVATTLSLGSQVVDVVASDDQSTVAFLSGAGTVSLMDLGPESPYRFTVQWSRGHRAGDPDRFWWAAMTGRYSGLSWAVTGRRLGQMSRAG